MRRKFPLPKPKRLPILEHIKTYYGEKTLERFLELAEDPKAEIKIAALLEVHSQTAKRLLQRYYDEVPA